MTVIVLTAHVKQFKRELGADQPLEMRILLVHVIYNQFTRKVQTYSVITSKEYDPSQSKLCTCMSNSSQNTHSLKNVFALVVHVLAIYKVARCKSNLINILIALTTVHEILITELAGFTPAILHGTACSRVLVQFASRPGYTLLPDRISDVP